MLLLSSNAISHFLPSGEVSMKNLVNLGLPYLSERSRVQW
jgi:hypothetical protein